MGVKAESHLEFVERFASDTRRENLVQSFESVVVTLVSADAFFDRQADFHRVLQRANAGERRGLPKGNRRIHKIIGFWTLAQLGLRIQIEPIETPFDNGESSQARALSRPVGELYFLMQKYNLRVAFVYLSIIEA
jgi:hypothetical protein